MRVEHTPRTVGTVWGLLVLNTLGSTGAETIVPLPRSLIQMVTMGALVAAFALALAMNLRLRVRPSAFLLLLSLLLVPSLISSVDLSAGFGALFRCGRFAVFVATLWLLSRWWDGSTTFVRYHIRWYFLVLCSVAAGLLLSPGAALPDLYGGRLVGALWPLTPPQIGQYAAVVVGLAVLLVLGRRTDRRSAALVIVPSLALLALTHTRTATIGLLAGLVVAIGSMVLTSAAARRWFGWALVCAAVAAVAFGSLLQAWFLRGQTEENFSTLTGRAKVWRRCWTRRAQAWSGCSGWGSATSRSTACPSTTAGSPSTTNRASWAWRWSPRSCWCRPRSRCCGRRRSRGPAPCS